MMCMLELPGSIVIQPSSATAQWHQYLTNNFGRMAMGHPGLLCTPIPQEQGCSRRKFLKILSP